jgi:hypothetical protein
MVHTGIFATKAEIDTKVGERVDTTGYTEAAINLACKQCEAIVGMICKYDFATNWGTLSATIKPVLSEFEACWVSLSFIPYNMELYGSRIQAEDLININTFKLKLILKELEKEGSAEFIKNGT